MNLLRAVIPPNDREHREGFSNVHILNKLTGHERVVLEDQLLSELQSQLEQKSSIDILIVQTIGDMGSHKSISTLVEVLNSGINNLDKIITAEAIYKLDENDEMIDIALDSFAKIDDKRIDPHYMYKLIPAFYHMINFDEERTRAAVEKYIHHKEYLVSYNAKAALGDF